MRRCSKRRPQRAISTGSERRRLHLSPCVALHLLRDFDRLTIGGQRDATRNKQPGNIYWAGSAKFLATKYKTHCVRSTMRSRHNAADHSTGGVHMTHDHVPTQIAYIRAPDATAPAPTR